MSFFTALSMKVIPLYLNVLLGYLAGRLLDVPLNAITRLMFYMIAPLIMFNGTLFMRLDVSILSLPFLTYTISCIMALTFYWIASKIWEDPSKNLVAFSAGTGNAGYYGLPLALLLFNEQGAGIYMMSLLGMVLFENSLGFYICEQGRHSPRDCLIKTLKLPILYAFLLAMVLNSLHVPIPNVFQEFMCHIKGTYTVLGMMILGLGIAGLQHATGEAWDFKFIGLTFLAKFIAWPAIIMGIVTADVTWLHFFRADIHQALILLSLVPMAVNTVILASIIQTNPNKATAAVLLSTLFALLYIPIMVTYLNATAIFEPFVCPVH